MTALFACCCLLVIAQLIYPACTILLARLFGRERLQELPGASAGDYGCIITAYRNASIASPLVESLLRQSHERLTVYLVADECSDAHLNIRDDRFVLLIPETPLRLKVKSIRYAVDRFRRPHNFVAVFDADNLAHPRFLENIDRYARCGYRCIQGRRTAKNLDSTYAALDSMGELYKNHVERYVPWLLGGSAVISGSGMATEASLYRAYLDSPDIQQGQHQWKKMLQEDKILQNFLVTRGVRIAFARRAVVFDEKVETGLAVETQRGRWLYSYFQNLPNSGRILLNGLFKADLRRLYFGFVTMALPMFMQLGAALLLAAAALFIEPLWSVALLAAMLVFFLGLMGALHLEHAPLMVWRALWQAPRFVLRQVLGLFRMRNPNKYFGHTEHRKEVSVDEVMGNDD